MKRLVVCAMWLVVSGSGLAAPFVWPANWTSSAPGEARYGGVLRKVNQDEYATLNPFKDVAGANLSDFLTPGGGLLRLDPTNYEFVPYMAESFTLSSDKRTWTFKLRSGMKWSDGVPITADDFISTLKIARDEAVGYSLADYFKVGDKPITVSKIDASTLRIVFPVVVVNAAENIAYFYPWPSHVFDPVYAAKGGATIKEMWALSENPKNIVSSGPFTFESYRPRERAKLGRNPYFGEWNKDAAGRPLPYLDGISLSIVRDQNAETAAFLTDQVDLFAPRTAIDLAQVKREIDGGTLKAVLKANVGPSMGANWMFFNWNRASDPEKQRLFRSADFRRAISHLIDRKALIEIAYGGFGQALYASVPVNFTDWLSPNLHRYEYDPDAARRLFARLGYDRLGADGFLVNRAGRVLEFDLTTTTFGVAVTLSNVFVDSARKAGVKVNLIVRDSGTVISLLNTTGDDRPFDAILFGGSGFYLEFPFIEDYYTCDGIRHNFNRSGRCLEPWETQVAALFARGLQETDRQKRQQIAYRIEDIWSEHQPFIYLPRANVHLVWNARVAGEFPASAINSYNWDRDIVPTLTWIRP